MQGFVILVFVYRIFGNFNHGIHTLRSMSADGKSHVIRHINVDRHLPLNLLPSKSFTPVGCTFSIRLSPTHSSGPVQRSWLTRNSLYAFRSSGSAPLFSAILLAARVFAMRNLLWLSVIFFSLLCLSQSGASQQE